VDGVIEEVGLSRRVENLAVARGAREIDASGRVVMPGFVDSHTHLADGPLWLDEYESRLAGAGGASGAGWGAAVHALRNTSTRRLEERLQGILAALARHGTTTVEVKAGYGGDTPTELKVLRVLARLNRNPLDIAATYMAAGAAVPGTSRKPTPDDLERLRVQVLPGVARRKMAAFADLPIHSGRNAMEAAVRYLESARHLGLPIKVHADEFEHTGGTLLAVRYGAASADHLVFAGPEEVEELARSNTVATLLPGSGFYLGAGRYAPARALVDAGAAVALASNYNPATSPTFSMPMIVSLACSQMGLTPAEAIAAATINGAHALRCGAISGSLEIGKAADLLILNASDYRELACRFGVNPVHATVKRGRLIYREGDVA
jgi:imidazolonepropionase